MSRYDDLRKQLGVTVTSEPDSSDQQLTGGSKYDDLRKSLGITNNATSSTTEDKQIPDQAPITYDTQTDPGAADSAFRQESKVLPGRDLPIVGPLLRGLDYISSNPISQATAEYVMPDQPIIQNGQVMPGTNARDNFMKNSGQVESTGASKLIGQAAAPFFVPGAGLGAGSAYREGAAALTSRMSPGLGQSIAREAAIGAPIGFGYEYAQGQADLGNAALYGTLGAAAGAAGPLIGKGIRAASESAGRGLTQAVERPNLSAAVDDFTKQVDASQKPSIPVSEGPTYNGVSLLNAADNTLRVPSSVADNPIASSEFRTASQTARSAEPAPPTNLRSGPEQNQADNLLNNTQDYAGNSIPFRQAPIQAERTINRNQVVQNMRKNLDATIDTGRLTGGRGVLGQYKGSPEVVRTKMAEDLQVISHEVGHHLDKKFSLNDPGFQSELDNMVNTANPGHLTNYPASKHLDEGIAEYVRLRLTDPQQAKQLAPNFTRFFDQQLDKKALKGLEASARDVDTWITQGEYNQAKGLIDFTGGTNKTPLNKDKVYAKFVDDLNYLKLAEKALKGKVGLGDESVYKMARLSRGMEEKAKLAVTRGIYDAQGNKISEGLTQIVKPLEEMGVKEKDFALYLAVLHAKDLKTLHGKQVPFTDGQMNAVLNRLDTQELRDIQKNIIKFNDALMDTLVDAQIIDPVSVTGMRKKYPNYVPFMRYFDDDAVAGFKNGGFGSAKGFANITNPLKKMSEEGSLRTIINPVESMIKNTFLVMNAAAKNKVGLQLADLSKIDGAGAWVEHVGQGGASPTEHVISVYENGQKQAYKIREPELYNAMLSLDTESSNSLLKFLGGTASILRAGATLTPEFMVRNAFRDVVGASINSTKYGFNPLDFAKGLFHVVGKTKTFDQFLSSGGAMGTVASLDRDVNREALRSVFRESLADKALNVITSPKELAKMVTGITPIQKTVGLLRKGAEISELSTKVGLFNKTLNKTGSLEEAAFTARDIMDFNRAGSAIRPANKAVAFLNASIQGTDRMARAFKDNPAGFMVRAFTTLVLPSIGLYYYNNNLPADMKKEYENIPQWQKDSFFILGIPGAGFARIPKPFEAGMLFSTGTDRVMKYIHENDPNAFKDYGATLLQSFTPPMMISAFTPLLEALTNHSLFRNAPIVPMGEQRLEKKDQYGLFTSELSKGIGKIVSKTPFKDTNAASPRIIDNTIRGYTAGLGQYAVDAIDRIMNGVTGTQKNLPAKDITEQPFLRSFFASTAGGGQIRQDFYDKWDELSKKKASADKNNDLFTDANYYRVKAGKDAIDKIMKAYKVIQADDKLSPAEKRTKLDQFDKVMNDLARKSLRK